MKNGLATCFWVPKDQTEPRWLLLKTVATNSLALACDLATLCVCVQLFADPILQSDSFAAGGFSLGHSILLPTIFGHSFQGFRIDPHCSQTELTPSPWQCRAFNHFKQLCTGKPSPFSVCQMSPGSHEIDFQHLPALFWARFETRDVEL